MPIERAVDSDPFHTSMQDTDYYMLNASFLLS